MCSNQLCQEAICLWEFCITNLINLRAACLPGKQNRLVDQLSRSFSNHREWSLHPDMARSIFQLWGTLQVDLFATKTNRKWHQFCSLWDFSSGSLKDVFLLSWRNSLLYTFPPIPLLPRVLFKVKQDHAYFMLIAPAWPQHWYSSLLTLSIKLRYLFCWIQDHSCLVPPSL